MKLGPAGLQKWRAGRVEAREDCGAMIVRIEVYCNFHIGDRMGVLGVVFKGKRKHWMLRVCKFVVRLTSIVVE